MTYSPYVAIDSSVAIEESNDQIRNALTPGLSSAEMLEHRGETLTPQQRQKHLSRIKDSISTAIAILEKNNSSLEEGRVILFRRKDDSLPKDFGI